MTSLKSALNQTLLNSYYDVLLIDDGSTDSINALVSEFNDEITYIKSNHIGYVNAANLGIHRSNSKYFILLDSDDSFFPSTLELLLKQIEGGDYCFVISDYIEKQSDGKETYVSVSDNIFSTIAAGILFEKESVLNVGCYDPHMVFPEYDLLIKLTKKRAKYRYINQALYVYNRHSGSVTANKQIVKKGFSQLIKKYGAVDGLRTY
jgi:glycosyltransferase involved in cell wall biosynthesis